MADCNFCYGLILVKLGDLISAIDSFSMAKQIFSNTVSAFDQKTKEVEELIGTFSMILKMEEGQN
jgi:hypothetical protein